jgi:soluble lytic murein transglycosylase
MGFIEPEIYIERELKTVGLDTLWATGGVHAHKFVLLATAGLWIPALGEWDAAAGEIGRSTGLTWWKSQLQLRSGDQLSAWRTVRRGLRSYITTAGKRPLDFYRVVYPLDFDPQIVRLSGEHKLDPYFVFALICQESHYEETIVSAAGAIGLMQLMPATAKLQASRIGTKVSTEELYHADRNLEIGIAHVAELWNDFQGDSVLVLAAYNAGKSIAQAWFEEFGHLDRDEFIESIPYRETRLFIKNIIEHAAAYRRLYPDVGTYPTASDE